MGITQLLKEDLTEKKLVRTGNVVQEEFIQQIGLEALYQKRTEYKPEADNFGMLIYSGSSLNTYQNKGGFF